MIKFDQRCCGRSLTFAGEGLHQVRGCRFTLDGRSPDRDLADLTIKVDANRQAINALGVQTVARFDQVDQRFDRLEQHVDNGFAEMRGRFDQTAAGMAQIVELLTKRLRELTESGGNLHGVEDAAPEGEPRGPE